MKRRRKIERHITIVRNIIQKKRSRECRRTRYTEKYKEGEHEGHEEETEKKDTKNKKNLEKQIIKIHLYILPIMSMYNH